MPTTSVSPDIYLRFLQLASTAQEASALAPLDPLEERILHVVATAQIERQRLSVRDLIGKSELGSSATLHSRLASMREKGWLHLSDTEDARRKQVELTEAALLYLDNIAYRIPEAIKGV